nr:hypothetical protein Iba_chr06eCG6200 [Ipomoea batatas]
MTVLYIFTDETNQYFLFLTLKLDDRITSSSVFSAVSRAARDSALGEALVFGQIGPQNRHGLVLPETGRALGLLFIFNIGNAQPGNTRRVVVVSQTVLVERRIGKFQGEILKQRNEGEGEWVNGGLEEEEDVEVRAGDVMEEAAIIIELSFNTVSDA